MKAVIEKSSLAGQAAAPPSKSMAHRLLIFASLANGISTVSNIAYSQDILATLDTLEAFGAVFKRQERQVIVDGSNLFKNPKTVCDCRQSGSTLRFLIPLAWVSGQKMSFYGSERLLGRPLTVYEDLAGEQGFLFENDGQKITTEGQLKPGRYQVAGNISSQFITGLLIALSLLEEDSEIEVVGKFESRSYVDLTVAAMRQFGGQVEFNDNHLVVHPSEYMAQNVSVEGDDSNAAFLDCFNFLDQKVEVSGLNPDSIQGDRFFHRYFQQLDEGCPTIDLQDCPDLGPILMAMAALKNGARFTNTARLAVKECDRPNAMKQELAKCGGEVEVKENEIIVYPRVLHTPKQVVDSHDDHRIVMAMSTVLLQISGEIENCEAINKSFPDYFDTIKQLGAKIEIL